MICLEFLMYSRENCSWCDKARELFKEKNAKFSEKKFERVPEWFREAHPEVKTLPYIVLHELHLDEVPQRRVEKIIGGYTELVEFYKNVYTELGGIL